MYIPAFVKIRDGLNKNLYIKILSLLTLENLFTLSYAEKLLNPDTPETFFVSFVSNK